MRKILALCVLAVVGSSGCQMLSGDRAHGGYGFYFNHPSTVDQQGITLINTQPGTQAANPMGTISGPVTDATSNHAATAPLVMPQAPIPVPRTTTIRSRIGATPTGCEPCGPPTLTVEDWCKIQERMGIKKMPAGE